MSNSNRNRRKTTFGSVVMRIAGVLLALTAVTVWATSFMFAKYTTKTEEKTESRVAKFDVDAGMEESDGLLIDVALGDTGKYIVTLTNDSETAVRGDLVLDFTELNTAFKDTSATPKPIPIIEEITVSAVAEAPASGNGTEPGAEVVIEENTYTLVNNKVMLSGVKDLVPGGKFTVTVDLGVDALGADAINAITANMTGLDSSAGTLGEDGDLEFPFYVKAIFTQID